MNVAFLITSLDFGGAEAQLVRIARMLRQDGWTVSVISMLSPAAYEAELAEAGITVHSLAMTRGAPEPAAVIRLVRLLKREKPDILTSFMYHANLLGRLAARPGGVRIVVSSIRNENFGGPRRDRLLRITDGLARVTTTNSRLAATALLDRGVVPEGKLRVIPNGLDLTNYSWTAPQREKARRETGCLLDSFLWLAVGRLELQKDWPTLLTAFASVAHRQPEAQLRIAGHGSLEAELKAQAQKLGLEAHVQFLGVRNDIPDLLAASDALVLSSAWEGLPNVVLEAMAAGKPVVATQVGGVPELVEAEVTGVLVPPADPAALAAAMLSLMQLPEEARHVLGCAGRQRAAAGFSLERVTGDWQSLFTELLE
jgi:glycosyltransferase involved in cell wall biosynthesis